MERWTLEWSPCDPQQCWIELWELWVLDGVRNQLCNSHDDSELIDHRSQEHELTSLRQPGLSFGLSPGSTIEPIVPRSQQKGVGPRVPVNIPWRLQVNYWVQ